MLRMVCFALAVLLPFSAWAQPVPVQHIQVGPLDRTYALQRTHTDQAAGRLPVVIFLHGLGTLVSEGPPPPRFDIPFASLPGIEPALVVRPQGVNRRWDSVPGRLTTWRRLSATNGEQVDDIAFLRALVDHLIADENGDPARIYVAGVSSGGFLVTRIACEMGDKVAAVADVIATSVRAVFQFCNSQPVPFAIIASTTDDTNPYAGVAGDEVSRLASAPDTAAFFAKHNGCTTRTETPLPHANPARDATISLVQFSGCTGDAEVRFYRVDGSRHSVPSPAPIEAGDWDASGRRSQDMDTAQTLWDFFRVRRLPAPP